MERIDFMQFDMANQRVLSQKEHYIIIHDDYLEFGSDYEIETREDSDDSLSPWTRERIFQYGVVKRESITAVDFYWDDDAFYEAKKRDRFRFFCIQVRHGINTPFYIKDKKIAKSVYERVKDWVLKKPPTIQPEENQK